MNNKTLISFSLTLGAIGIFVGAAETLYLFNKNVGTILIASSILFSGALIAYVINSKGNN